MRSSVYTLEKRLNQLLQEQPNIIPCESMTIEERSRFLCEYASVICPDDPNPYEAILNFFQNGVMSDRDILTEYADEIYQEQCIPAGEMGEHRITPTIETPIPDFNSPEIPPQEHPAPSPVKLPRADNNVFRERVLMQRERDGHNPFDAWKY